MYQNQPITEIYCSNARELWERLRPENNKSKNIIYRGQSNHEWSLVPSLCRNGATLFSADEEAFFELNSIKHFIEACDQQGIGFYGDSTELRKVYLDPRSLYRSLWPNDELINVIALCQHHGMKTRLLDWTSRGYVAAYFAAASAIGSVAAELSKPSYDAEKLLNRKLVIWALNEEKIGLADKVKVVKVPGSISPNLAAQSGLLMYRQEVIKNDFQFKNIPLDSCIPADDCEMVKFTLPVSESVELLDLCELYQITTASMFPGYDGAARHVELSEQIHAVANFFTFSG